MKYFVCLVLVLTIVEAQGQSLPLREIPAAPDSYTTGAVIARFTEGLGFRYYWATDGLRPEDLDYRPSPDARTARETIVHIFGLTRFTYNTIMGDTIDVSADYTQWEIAALRAETLEMLQMISIKLRGEAFVAHSIKYPSEDGTIAEMPFWNLLNGPVSDAIYHTGQLVTMRRASGNPINPDISVFTGTVQK